MLDMLKKWKDYLVLVAFFLAILAWPVRLFAEDFIDQTVGQRIATLEQQIEDLKDSNLKAEGDLEALRKLLEQQFSLMKFLAGRERVAP